MQKTGLMTGIILVVLAITMTVIAQDNTAFTNDPATHENANACYDGGTMVGKCNDDSNGDGFVSDEEIAWAWTCGWYIIRYNSAIFNRVEVPATCQILLPSPSASEVSDLAEFYGGSAFASLGGGTCSSGTINVNGSDVILIGGIYTNGCDFSGDPLPPSIGIVN